MSSVTSEILSTLLSMHRSYLEQLASAWLMDGASSVSLWAPDSPTPLICWPDSAAQIAPNLVTDLNTGRKIFGHLGVVTGDSPQNRRRLEAEAGLLVRLAQIENDMQTMTADLISSQDQLLALYDLAETFRSRANLDEMLAALACEIARLVKTSQAFVLLTWRGSTRLVHYSAPVIDEGVLHNLAQRVQTSGERLLLKSGDSLLPPNIANLLIEPLRVRGTTLAVIGLLNKPDGFSSPDIKLAHGIAEQLGAQLENTLIHQDTIEQMRMKTEMELAQQVQVRLLPHEAPQVKGLDVFAGTKPALQVGGDFFDFIPLTGNDSFMFTVGDVSGKGLPAALLMAMTRTVLRSKARMLQHPSPQGILTHANEDMYDDFTEVSMFATVFVGQYHPDKGALMFSNAGHSPVIYRPFNGSAQLIEAEAPALGVLDFSLAENREVQFQSGDLLVVATDGFNEARNLNGEMFGYQHLLELVDSLAYRPAREIAEELYAAVNAHEANRSQDDDQTIIVLRRTSDA